MSQKVTQNVASTIQVLLSKDSVAVTGLVFGDVTVDFRKEAAGSFTNKVLAAPDFVEIGNGIYDVLFTAGELDTAGDFTVVVNGAAVDQSTTLAEVLAPGETTTTVSLETCTITGHIFNANGKPEAGAAVTARVLGMPSIEQNVASMTDDLVSTETGANGEFFLSLVRLADVEIIIPRANFRRTLVVPNESSANLFTDIP